ncbi:uncharacterized protein LOC144824913 [Lissotriton helveticus]
MAQRSSAPVPDDIFQEGVDVPEEHDVDSESEAEDSDVEDLTPGQRVVSKIVDPHTSSTPTKKATVTPSGTYRENTSTPPPSGSAKKSIRPSGDSGSSRPPLGAGTQLPAPKKPSTIAPKPSALKHPVPSAPKPTSEHPKASGTKKTPEPKHQLEPKKVSDSKKHPEPKKPSDPKRTPASPVKDKRTKEAVPAPKRPFMPTGHTPEKDLLAPDLKQKTLVKDTKTGRLTLSKKRLPEAPAPAPAPKRKKDMATSPMHVPHPAPAPTPPPHTSPLSPVPSSTHGDNGDDESDTGADPQEPVDPPDSPDPWVDYKTPDIPDVPQDDIYPSRPSPPEDTMGFNQLLIRAAQYHGVDMDSDTVEEDFLLDTFDNAQQSSTILPMLKGVVKHAPEVFKDPVRTRVINPRVEKKYKAAPSDPAYIKGPVPLDSLVVSNTRKRANSQTSGEAPPPDKESKLLDASGKRTALQAANMWRIANTQALLARYDRVHYDELEDIMQHLPDQFKDRDSELIQEGKIITNTSIRCALDAADTASRANNTSVLLRRHAWLRISGSKPEVQSAILNRPFDEQHLFGPEVDVSLEKMKKDTDTAKSMGALQSQAPRRSFRRSTYRGASRGYSSDTPSTGYKSPTQSTYGKGYQRGGYCGNNNKSRGKNNNSRSASTPTQ